MKLKLNARVNRSGCPDDPAGSGTTRCQGLRQESGGRIRSRKDQAKIIWDEANRLAVKSKQNRMVERYT
jgi:hypothetical protein